MIVGRVGQRVGGGVEQQQHAVGLVDLAPAARREQVACDPVVCRPQLGHGGVAERLRQLGAVDNIGQEKGSDFVHARWCRRRTVR